MKLTFFSLLIALGTLGFTAKSFASGGLISGGGYGVVSGSHVYLLDLVEAGSEKVQAPVYPSPRFNRAAKKFGFLTPAEQSKLATKIQQITEIDPVLGAIVLKALLSYQWMFTNEDLQPIDAVETPLAVPTVVLAVRQSMVVYISKSNWQKMPSTHRVALLIHESLSALLFPDAPAIWARQFIGTFFSRTERRPALSEALLEQIHRAWPTRAYLQSVINPDAANPTVYLYYEDLPNEPMSIELGIAPFAKIKNNDQSVKESFALNLVNRESFADAVCEDLESEKDGLRVNEVVLLTRHLDLRLPKGSDERSPRLEVYLKEDVIDHAWLRPSGLCQKVDRESLNSLLERFEHYTWVL